MFLDSNIESILAVYIYIKQIRRRWNNEISCYNEKETLQR